MDNLKSFFNTCKEMIHDGLEKARSIGLGKKIATGILIFTSALFLIVIVLKALGYAFSFIYSFIDNHFFETAGLFLGGIYLKFRWDEKRDARKREQLERMRSADNVKIRFAEGSYDKVRQFLWTQVMSETNFSELTSMYRPVNPREMGNPEVNNFVKNGIIFHQFRIPKVNLDSMDKALVMSVLQSTIDQKIAVYGIPSITSPLHTRNNSILMVHSLDDMKTYALLTTALNFDGQYMEQATYEQAISDSLNISNVERDLRDSDYHG